MPRGGSGTHFIEVGSGGERYHVAPPDPTSHKVDHRTHHPTWWLWSPFHGRQVPRYTAPHGNKGAYFNEEMGSEKTHW
jgi:hypothetical protein